jgi:two-component system, cell cycle response regulator
MTLLGRPTGTRQSVLVIDDAQDIHDVVEVRLRAEGVDLVHAFDAEAGMELARAKRPDLYLLDLDLPGRSGLELCRALKDEPALASAPVIILTGTVDVATKVRAFDAGATDYVTKPFDAVELRARVRAALRTKRYQDLLATQARIDALTGLWNRAFFDTRLAEELAVTMRDGSPLALLMVDIDHFKAFNDSYGHPFGDQVLRQVAAALVDCLRVSDIACRYGGEEFALLVRSAETAARAVGERVCGAVAALVIRPAGGPVQVTVSVGCSGTDALAGETSASSLVAAADRGLYLAKRAGRNRVCFERDVD